MSKRRFRRTDAGVAGREREAELREAVARMTEAANAEGLDGLVMTAEEWKALVERYIYTAELSGFGGDVIARAGTGDIDTLNRFLALAGEIWNATPQRDRGGRTAGQIYREGGRPA